MSNIAVPLYCADCKNVFDDAETIEDKENEETIFICPICGSDLVYPEMWRNKDEL